MNITNLNKPACSLDVDHFQSTPDGSSQDVGVPQVVAVIGQLHKFGDWKNESIYLKFIW